MKFQKHAFVLLAFVPVLALAQENPELPKEIQKALEQMDDEGKDAPKDLPQDAQEDDGPNTDEAPKLSGEALAKHRAGSEKVADLQDELSADVQQLVIEQTVPKVIEMFNEVEKIMDETTDRLAGSHTDGDTMAAQTEIIEKIHAAAKEKQKQQGGGQSGSAMMDMMERMMGEKKEGDAPGKGEKPSDKGGQGMTGLSDEGNTGTGVGGETKSEIRRIPKASGAAGHVLPEEFKKAMDAYNRGAEKKVK